MMRKYTQISLSIVIAAIIVSFTIYFSLQNLKTKVDVVESFDKLEIEIDEIINKYLPVNYEIYDYYYENLDDDEGKEILVILKEHSDYTTKEIYGEDIEYFGRLPIQLMVLDYADSWHSTLPVVANTGSATTQHVFIPYNHKKPYRIVQNGGRQWIMIYTTNYSFDGTATFVGMFRYDNTSELKTIKLPDTLWGSYVFDRQDGTYFLTCNPFSEEHTSQKLDFSGNVPVTKQGYPINKSICDYIWENSPSDIFENDQELFESLFISQGVTFT